MLDELSNIYMEKGLKSLHKGKLTTAKTEFQKAVCIDDNNWQAKNLQGLCLYTTGEFKRAFTLWKKSIEINKEENNRAHFYIANMKERDFKTICEVYNEALKEAQEGSLKKSERLLRDYAFDNCRIIPLMNFKGLCMLGVGKRSEAIAIWKKVLLIDRENEEAHNYIINCFDKEHNENFIYRILKKLLNKS